MPLSRFILVTFIRNMHKYYLRQKANVLEATVFYVIYIFCLCDFLYFFISF